MKTILVATDFSPASRNAAKYGVELARAFSGKVILTTAYQQVPVSVTEPLVLVAPDMAAFARQTLQAEANALSTGIAAPVEILAIEGVATHSIVEAAKELNADLIIVGMKGSGKATRRFFGSTATSLARKTTIPLLVIPEGVSYKNPATIALASDIAPHPGIHLLDALQTLVGKFHSALYVVRIIAKKSDEVMEILNRPFPLGQMVEKMEPLYEYPVDKNITKALHDFISTHHVDMLAMIPHKEALPERWFLRSNTREMIFITDIPLLILPEDHKMRGRATHSVIY